MGGDGITIVWTHELEEIESEDELDSEDLFSQLSQTPVAESSSSRAVVVANETTPMHDRVITREHLLSYLTDKSKMNSIASYFGENSKEIELLQNLKVSTVESAFASMDVDRSDSIDLDEWPRFLEVNLSDRLGFRP